MQSPLRAQPEQTHCLRTRIHNRLSINTKASKVVNIKHKCATRSRISAKPFDGRIPFDRLFCREDSRFSIMSVRRVNNNGQQIPHCVHDYDPYSQES